MAPAHMDSGTSHVPGYAHDLGHITFGLTPTTMPGPAEVNISMSASTTISSCHEHRGMLEELPCSVVTVASSKIRLQGAMPFMLALFVAWLSNLMTTEAPLEGKYASMRAGWCKPLKM